MSQADQETATFDQAVAGGWRVTASCEPCRILISVNARDLGPAGGVPIAQLWARRRLVCERCRAPFSGLQVEDPGDSVRKDRIIGRWFEPGHWPDPELARRWKKGPS